MSNIGLCGGVHMEICGYSNGNNIVIKWVLLPNCDGNVPKIKMSLPLHCERALYVCEPASPPMQAAKRPADVTSEVNLRNPLHARNKECKCGIHPGFETQGRHDQKSKTGLSVAPIKYVCPPKNSKKENYN